MTMDTGVLSRDEVSSIGAWAHVFNVDSSQTEFLRMRSLVAVEVRDIYTGMMPYTRNLYGAMNGGQVQMIRRSVPQASFAELLRLIALMLTHSRLARTKAAPLASPASYIRSTSGWVWPTLPLRHLEILSGVPERDLVLMLSPLVKDNVASVFSNRDGIRMVVISNELAHEGAIRSFLKF